MKYNEIMAAIQQLKNTVANVQCEIAALEELVANENHQEETPDETPVVNEVSNVSVVKGTVELEYNEEFPSSAEITEYNEELDMAIDAYYSEYKESEEKVEELPAPPAEVHIDIPKDNIPNKDVILGCKILTDLDIDYSGVCSVIKMHKLYFDNGQPKLYINKYKVVIELYNSEMEVIKIVTTHWNNLAKFHTELIARGINTHAKGNWLPKTLVFDLD